MNLPAPRLAKLRWRHQYRVIASAYPPIDFFEELVEPEQMDALWHIESLTNDRLRETTGNMGLVAPEDRVSGPGSTPVMAAFTHIGRPSRFTDGRYGVYYASKTLATAIKETIYQKERFLAATREAAGELAMRVYVGGVLKPLHDLRREVYAPLHDPNDYTQSQRFAENYRDAHHSWGFVYPSVRDPGGENIAIFRPPAVSIPSQGPHLGYHWDGERVTAVYEKSTLLRR
jgi:hypothetical protein